MLPLGQWTSPADWGLRVLLRVGEDEVVRGRGAARDPRGLDADVGSVVAPGGAPAGVSGAERSGAGGAGAERVDALEPRPLNDA